MSAEPLSREVRDLLGKYGATDADALTAAAADRLVDRYEATVQEREATIARIRNAIAALDGHTCHEGHTDADHLAMYRAVVGEVRAALEGAA